MMYVQCSLSSGTCLDVRWIPKKYAIAGKIITIKEDKSSWRVDHTYGEADEKQVVQMRDLHKNHRKGTDI